MGGKAANQKAFDDDTHKQEDRDLQEAVRPWEVR